MSVVVVGTGVRTLADVTPRWDRASQTWRSDCPCGWRWHDSTERLAQARGVQHDRDGCWPANVHRLH